MAIVIKKKVSFDFLGEEYKEAYIIFQSIPVKDYQKIFAEEKKIGEDNIKATDYMRSVLTDYFIEGKFPDNGELADVKKEDLGDLDGESTINCFKILTGQDIDPKAEGVEATPTPSSTTDTTSK